MHAADLSRSPLTQPNCQIPFPDLVFFRSHCLHSHRQNPLSLFTPKSKPFLLPPHLPSYSAMIEIIPPPKPAPRRLTLSQDRYVVFNDVQIRTLVTNSPSKVDSWIYTTEDIRGLSPRLIAGLDVEWRPNFCPGGVQNPVATLQLCVGRRCLIFQLIHASFIPNSLICFLGNATNTFVGVSIEEDAKKLLEQYDLKVATVVDLRVLAAEKLGMPELRSMGLKALAKEVLGKEMEKPKWIATGSWDDLWLTLEQIRYASIDAFMSYEIGLFLYYGV